MQATEIDNEIFLVDAESDKIFYLDEISSGIWRILDNQCNIDDLVKLFEAAFPETPGPQIKSDLTKVVENMSELGGILIDADNS